MQNKLQELTDKLYNEGLSKGKSEGEQLVKDAKAEAQKIVNQAKTEAESILASARREAEELKTKVSADVKMAAVQSIAVTKQEVEKLVIAKTVDAAVAKNLSSEAFVQEMIKTIVAAFNPANAEPVDLDIILPASMKDKMDAFVKAEVSQHFKGEVKVSYSKKIGGGFKISPKDGSYVLQFTDEEFNNLISNYMRPATKKILFG